MVLQKTWLSLFVLFFSVSAFSAKPLSYKTKKISLSGHILNVAIADDDEKRAKGMMFIQAWDKFDGMLFIFKESQIRRFWMKNTFLHLSLGFYDENKKLLQTAELRPPRSVSQTDYDFVMSKKRAKYVIELPKNWFKENKVKLGSSFKLL